MVFVLQNAFTPEPVLQVNAPSASRIAELERQWQQVSGEAISDAARERMIQAEINQAILLNEAISRNFHRQDDMVIQRMIRDMRFMYESSTDSDDLLLEQAYMMDLHKNDLVARRRLIQMMESELRAPGENQAPSEQVLRAAYHEAEDQFVRPERLSFSHVFVSRDRYRDKTKDTAELLLRNIHSQSIQADAAVSLGDPFIIGHFFRQQSIARIERDFGDEFALGLSQCPVDQWCEAVESAFGLHHVWLYQKLPSERLPFEAVRPKLEYELRHRGGEESLAEGLARLRERYQVVGVVE